MAPMRHSKCIPLEFPMKSGLAKVATPVMYMTPPRVRKLESAARRDPVEGMAGVGARLAICTAGCTRVHIPFLYNEYIRSKRTPWLVTMLRITRASREFITGVYWLN
jgi:hypothetical protein